MNKQLLLTVRMTEKDRERWGVAATAVGVSLSAWIRQVLDAAADAVGKVPADVVQARRLDDAARKVNTLLVSARSKGKPPLCERCSRIGSPSCADCRKAWGLA